MSSERSTPRAETPDQAGAAPDRPWLNDPPKAITDTTIATWRRALDNSFREVDLSLVDGSRRREAAVDLMPGISVVVPTYRGRDHIARCLDSLAAQTLHPSLFEIIVILNGEPDGTRELVANFRKAHSTINLRSIQMSTSGASRARNIGVAAAGREYLTFVDDDDYVSATMLEVLLAHVGPRVIAITQMSDVHPDGQITDSYLSPAIRKYSGNLTHPADIPSATSVNAAKAVSTRIARGIPYDESLESGEDVLFWATVAVRGNVDFLPCSTDEDAVYYRVLRDNSVSRQSTTFDFAVRQRLDVIRALERLASECEGGLRGLVQDRINAQSGFIGNYLRQFPAEHPRVVHELDRLPVFNLQYERINLTDARGLVIAYAFPPYADTSAVVMAKRVRAKGEVADVIQNSMDRIRKTDQSLRRISGPFVSRVAALPTPSFFADWGAVEAFATKGMEVVGKWKEGGRRYEWVYSRAQFAASHFLAAAVKVSQPSIKWIAEFSDPLSRDVQNRERGTPIVRGELVANLVEGLRAAGRTPPVTDNFFTWCEEIAYALADELLFTNESQLEYMLGYCSDPALADLARKKAVVAPQPMLPSEFYSMMEYEYPLDPDFTHFAYFGNFYANRGLDDVLLAIRHMGDGHRHGVRLHVFTNSPEELERAAALLEVADMVIARPYIPYLEFLNLTTKFDCLIVNDAATAGNHDRNPYLPSKWADYRGSGTAVWGLVEAGSPLSHEPLHYVSPVGDHEAASSILHRVVATKSKGRLSREPLAERSIVSGGGDESQPSETPSRERAAVSMNPAIAVSTINRKDQLMKVPSLRRSSRRRDGQEIIDLSAAARDGSESTPKHVLDSITTPGRAPRILCGHDNLPMSGEMRWTDCELVPGETYRVRTLMEGTSETADRAAIICFEGSGGGSGLTASDVVPPYVYLRTGPGLWRTDRLVTVTEPSKRFGLMAFGNRGSSTLKTLTIERIDDSRPTDFFMSFDTEALKGRASAEWIDRLVWGKVDGGEYGLRRICDVLDQYKIKANFMIDYASCTREGDQSLRDIVDFIRERGHEIHLHSHPEQLWGPWGMNGTGVRFDRMTYGMSRRLLDYAARTHRQFVGEEPRVFRTGGLFLNENLIHAAQAVGIPVLSNVRNNVVGNPLISGDVPDSREPFLWDNGVEEMPIDFALDPLSEPLDYYLGKFNELARRKTTERTFNMLMHSWSLLKLSDKGFYEIYAPDHEERLHVLCQHVTQHGTALGYSEFLDRPRPPIPTTRLIRIRSEESQKPEYAGPVDIVACNICDMSFSRAKVTDGVCLGCGAGIRERQLAQAFEEYGNVFDDRDVLAHDAAGLMRWDMLAGASTVTGYTAIADLDDVADDSVDCVAALYLVEHLVGGQDAVATVGRVLKRGGIFVWASVDGADVLGNLSTLFDVTPMPAYDPVSGETARMHFAYKR